MNRWIGLCVCLLMTIAAFAKTYQTFEENGKVGMKDDSGNVILPPSFEALGWSDGNFSVAGEVTGYRLNGSWGIINLKKEFISKAEYESLVYSGGDCIVARKKINPVVRKTGCINLKGEIKVPFIYDGITVQGLRAIVFNLSGARYYYGLTDLENRILIPVTYKNIQPLGTLRFAVENSENKIALFGDLGNPITEFAIDSISLFYKGFAIVYQNHLQGLIDRDGQVKLEIKYNSINIDKEGKVLAQHPNEWFLINGKNETTKQLIADEVKPISGKNFIVRKGKVSGIVDGDLKTVLPTKYERLAEIESGKYYAKQNGKMGVISEKGENIVSFSFDSLISERDYYRAYDKNFGWQLLSKIGKKLTEKYYQKLLPSNHLGFPVVSKDFSGLINFEGHEFIHCVFDSVATPVGGLMVVKFKNQFGIIDINEDWRIAPQQYPLQVINQQRYFQKQPGNYFIKSFDGQIIYFTPYPIVFNRENFVEFLPDGTERTNSYDGEFIHRTEMPSGVDTIFPEHEGLRGIKKDGRYGFVDNQGRLRIANRYDSIGEFHEGLASIKLIGMWGFANTDDQIVINPNYDSSSFFLNGLAVVSRNKKFGVINKSGNAILALRYDYIRRLTNGKFLLVSSSQQGLADEKGNVLVEPRFSSLREVGNGFLVANNGEKWGAMTDQGLSVIPMIYDQLKYVASEKLFLAEKKSTWKLMEIK